MAPASSKLPIHQKIINAVAQSNARGIPKAPRKKIASICGYPKETKSYNNALGKLRKNGWIHFDRDSIEITTEGRKHADAGAPLGSNVEALEEAKSKFKSAKQKQLLQILYDNRLEGRIESRADIAARIGADHTKKSFTNILSPVKTQGFMDYVKDAEGQPALEATDELFPFAMNV